MSQYVIFAAGATPPGVTNIEFIAGNDAVAVGPDPATHIFHLLGDTTKNISVTNTAPFTDTITIGDATAGANAGAASLGVASFNSAGFNVTSGFVSLNPSIIGTWIDESTTFTPIAGNGYFVTGNATAVLPVATQGNTISFIVDGAVTLTITGNTGQFIQLGAAKSVSAGTAVNAAATTGCTITLVFRASDSVWIALSSEGTWTIT